MIICYISILRKYHTVKNDVSRRASERGCVDSTVKSVFDDPNEVIILFKAVIIVGALLFCWTPYMCTVLYQIASSENCNGFTDFITALLVNINPALNPYILILFDARVRQNVESNIAFPRIRSKHVKFCAFCAKICAKILLI
ncbi:MAG: hypothetical protein RIR48_1939 [Bacteroidota bacterium]